VLLESVAAKEGFDLSTFRGGAGSVQDLPRIFDQATKQTLRIGLKGKPSRKAGASSTDLSGAARIAPLVFLYHKDPETLVNAARAKPG